MPALLQAPDGPGGKGRTGSGSGAAQAPGAIALTPWHLRRRQPGRAPCAAPGSPGSIPWIRSAAAAAPWRRATATGCGSSPSNPRADATSGQGSDSIGRHSSTQHRRDVLQHRLQAAQIDSHPDRHSRFQVAERSERLTPHPPILCPPVAPVPPGGAAQRPPTPELTTSRPREAPHPAGCGDLPPLPGTLRHPPDPAARLFLFPHPRQGVAADVKAAPRPPSAATPCPPIRL